MLDSGYGKIDEVELLEVVINDPNFLWVVDVEVLV